MKKSWMVTGIALLSVGVISLLGATEVIPISMGYIWPLSLLLPGLYFESAFFFKREAFKEEILIPSGLLIVYALYFYVAQARGFALMQSTWPIFPLGVSLGFLQAYFLGEHKFSYLLVGQILLVFSVMAILFTTLGMDIEGVVFPIVLIFLGVLAIVQAWLKNKV